MKHPTLTVDRSLQLPEWQARALETVGFEIKTHPHHLRDINAPDALRKYLGAKRAVMTTSIAVALRATPDLRMLVVPAGDSLQVWYRTSSSFAFAPLFYMERQEDGTVHMSAALDCIKEKVAKYYNY